MTLSVINTIPDVVLARNPVGIMLETDNFIITPAVTQLLDLVFTGGALEHDNITLEWSNKTVAFEFATTPDSSGTQLPKYVSGDIDVWLASVVQYLNYNYYLVSDFIVAILTAGPASGTIRILARQSGSDYALTVTENISNCTASATTGADAVVNSNFMINLDVWVEISGTWERAGAISIPPDANDRAVFYIDKLLLANIYPSIPDFGEATIRHLDALVLKWKAIFAESYGDTSVFKKTSTTEEHYALRAGFAFTDFPGIDYWDTWLPANKKFMTWCPNNKKIEFPYSEEYLHYLVISATTLNLKVKCYYSDGTDQTLTVLTSAGVAAKQIHRIPAGYFQLDIGANFTIPAGESVTKYDLWLEDQDDIVISEVRTYISDPVYFRNNREFIFENSMGGFDTIRCRGETEYNVDTSAVETESILPDYWGLSSFDKKGKFAIDLNYMRDGSVVRTGYLTKAELLWLKELFLSKFVYEVRNLKHIPVIVQPGSFKLYTTNDDLFALEFEVKDAFEQNNYSNAGYSGSGSGS